jgi:hypothetical protein
VATGSKRLQLNFLFDNISKTNIETVKNRNLGNYWLQFGYINPVVTNKSESKIRQIKRKEISSMRICHITIHKITQIIEEGNLYTITLHFFKYA